MAKTPKTFSYLLKAHVMDEYYNEGPTHAVIKFTLALIKRILHLAHVVAKSKAAYIADYDNSPDWLTSEYDLSEGIYIKDKEPTEWDGRMDCVYLSVYDNILSWKGYIKHTNVKVETECLNISDLKQYLSVMSCPKKKLPLLIGTLNESVNKYLMARIGMDEK
jgi:hypothetical protein